MGDNWGSNLIEQLVKIKNGVSARLTIFFIVLLTGAFVTVHWSNVSVTGASFLNTFLPSMRSDTPPVKINSNVSRCPIDPQVTTKPSMRSDTPAVQINCTVSTCPTDPQVTPKNFSSSAEACPEYFKWIHEDLRPWKDTGITKDMVDSVEKRAYIRIVVVNGRVYVKKFKWVFETRDVFTIWGILQLLRLYPGQVPDLDIMFEMGDFPVIKQSKYPGLGDAKIPVMFHYCGSDSTFDITFPDWSFWGWPEVNVKPWENFRKELEEGNHICNWKDRGPYAYWRGNAALNPVRQNLLRCSEKPDSGARIYQLDWQREREGNFEHTDYTKQCTHRYKIYAEGYAWSISEKYILACDSMSLFITPHYYDFFTRSLSPTIHFWPVNEKDLCRSIKFAVDWGNKNTEAAQEIGKAGSKFLQEELQMKHVYDYMFHLLYNYGKLLKYTPPVPEGAVEYCLESMACSAGGKVKDFLIDSMVKGPADSGPCILPQPYDSASLQAFLDRKANLTKQVEKREAGKSK